MGSAALVRGMGSFFKECEHPRSRWSPLVQDPVSVGGGAEVGGVRVRDPGCRRRALDGNLQGEEGGAAGSGEGGADRPVRRDAVRGVRRRVEAGQRDLGSASVVHLESLLNIHLLPLLGSRRMNTFDHKVVEGFLQTMERNGVGLAAQANAFDKLKAILLDTNRLGLFA